jgi:RNA-splicing ligase RtcB
LGQVDLGPEGLARLEAEGKGDLAARMRASSISGDRFSGLALVTHHGSRGLGAKVYTRGQNAATKHTQRVAQGIPSAAHWLDVREPDGASYWEALQYVSRWTLANHQSIHRRFLERSGANFVCGFGNEHNFVWKHGDVFLHGKGATPAWRGPDGHAPLGLIPLNMAEPILLVLGSDHSDFLSFAPHGAGRNLSRTATLRPFRKEDGSLDERRVQTEIARRTAGLDIRWWYGRPDLSETPIGYKSAAQVKAQIAQFGLADVLTEVRPLGCIMAGDMGTPPWLRKQEELTPKQIRQIGHRAERRKTRQNLSHLAGEPDED